MSQPLADPPQRPEQTGPSPRRVARRFARLTAEIEAGAEPPPGYRRAVVGAFGALARRDLLGQEPPRVRNALVRHFFRLFYKQRKQTWDNSYFLGVKILKNPLDLWIYQELLHELRPDVIIEAGTKWGGSAHYLARICDLVENGRIVTIDVKLPKRAKPKDLPQHRRVTYMRGSSTDPAIVEQVKSTIHPGEKVLVILDSNHTRDHVYAELQAWAPVVNVGSYVIVEDTCMNGHPIGRREPGPMEAVEDFLVGRDDFVIDKSRERFFVTFNPNGYLKRVAPDPARRP